MGEKHFTCKSGAQKRAIRASYARIRAAEKQSQIQNAQQHVPKQPSIKPQFPDKYPFWARLKICKRRTTLVIDEDQAYDKEKKQMVPGYVHREATSIYHKGFEEITPNPDKDKSDPMYLKSPRKLPKYLFEPHNKKLEMPENLRQRYDKNNYKSDTDDKKDT